MKYYNSGSLVPGVISLLCAGRETMGARRGGAVVRKIEKLIYERRYTEPEVRLVKL